MTFSITQKTLERLEWPQILARLRAHARTPRGRSASGGSPAELEGDYSTTAARVGAAQHHDPLALHLFEGSRLEAARRLTETCEARALLGEGEPPPLQGIVELAEVLLRARKGGVLAARELLDVRSTTIAFSATAHFLVRRREVAHLLVEHAEQIADFSDLEFEIDAAIDPSGEVRDDATEVLADARREVRRLDAEIQASLERLLRDSSVLARLSDRYFTIRNDRYVLPVRADSRAGFRGIVHDVSSSGTTLFIEPELLVDLNNRRRQAELAIERESLRILRELSGAAGRLADEVETAALCVTRIDLAFARAHLGDEMNATNPEVLDEGVVNLPLLRHPLLPADEAVANDLRLGRDFQVLVISGPNAGGKTVAMKAAALAALFVRAGLHVPAAPGARVDFFDAIHADIGDEQGIRESLSTFSGHMVNLAHIVEVADCDSLVVLDELGVGTDPGEGAAIAQASLEALANAGARVIVTTHYNLLKEMAEVDTRFANASVDFDERTLEPTYRLRYGVAGSSSATAVASRMGLRGDVVERAAALLEREDRQLDRMLSELGASRSALEREQLEATRARTSSEAVRDEYRAKLEDLRDRREKLFHTMRKDLDQGFRDAHAQIAAVIRGLQQGGTARDAADARERLQELDTRAKEFAAEAGLADKSEARSKVDWRKAHAGDLVRIDSGSDAVLLALPDKRGRVAIRQGSARVVISAERVFALEAAPKEEVRGRPTQSPKQALVRDVANEDSTPRCDLRGLRVDEALEELEACLDRAISADRQTLVVVHGIGTGVLRRAVRKHLESSPYVASFENAESGGGGDGATVARLC